MLKRTRNIKKGGKRSNSASAKKVKRKKRKNDKKNSDFGKLKEDENGSENMEQKLSKISDSAKYGKKNDDSEIMGTGEESVNEEGSSDILIKSNEKEIDDISKEYYEEKQILCPSVEKDSMKEAERKTKETVIPSNKKKDGSPLPKKKAESRSKKKAESFKKKTTESPPPKKKTIGSPHKKKTRNSSPEKKAESPSRKEKDESPSAKKIAESPSPKKKAESPLPKKKVKNLSLKKKMESPSRKKKAKTSPPTEKTKNFHSEKKIAISSKKPTSPPPKMKTSDLLVKRTISDTIKKEALSFKQNKEKKYNGINRKKSSKKNSSVASKQDKEKKYETEDHKPVDYEQDEPVEEGIEQFQELIRKEGEHDPAAAAKERERKEEQLREITTILENFDAMFQQEKLKDWEDEQWKRYLRECGKADPLITCEANGYITTWQDLTEDEDAMSILRESHSCLELVKELELAIEESPNQTPEKEAAWILTHKNLHKLLQDKLDKATYELLKGAANYLDPDTYNMRLVTSDVRAIHEINAEKIDEAEVLLLENNASILLCIWANLVRNPRFKGPTFSQIGHSVELPRSLLLAECALRILHTSFDPYSLYRLNEKQRSQDQISGKQKESDEENSEISSDITATSLNVTPTSLQTESSTPILHSTLTKPTKRKKKQAKVIKSPRPSESKPSPIEAEGDKRDDEDDELGGSMVTRLKLFLPQQIVDMKGNYILGGVFHIDLVAIPPLPVTSANWVLEQVEKNQKLQHIKYHIDVTPPRPPKPGEKPTQAAMYAEAENRRYEDELTSAISVTLKLPDLVLFLDQPQLAFWNEDNCLWVNEGFHELKYNEDNKSLTFKMVHFGVIGIVQSKYVNFPYQAWELKPKEYCNSCSLSITGAQVSIVIEIIGGQCCISQLQTLEDSASHTELCNEWMKARQLLKKLKNIGIYVVPDEYATFYLGNTPKEKELEDSVYKYMAIFADVYMFGSSHWNTTVGPKRIVMKYSPTCGKAKEGINNLLLVDHEQAIFLQCVEQSSSFHDEPLAGSECCAILYHLLLSGATSNGLGRMKQSSNAYCSCIYKLLSSIKLLSY